MVAHRNRIDTTNPFIENLGIMVFLLVSIIPDHDTVLLGN